MALPYSVQKQAEYVEQIEKQLAGEPAEAPKNAESTENRQPEPKLSEPVESNRDDEFRKLEARYKTLQGMHQAENARWKAREEEAAKERQKLMEELQSLRTQVESKSEPLVSEEDKEVFGEDMVDFVKRAAQEEVRRANPESMTMQAEINRMKQELQAQREMQARDEQMSFFTSLDNALPDWRSQNEDKEFLAWLAEPDPVYNVRRQELLERAVAAKDVNATASIFMLFRQRTNNPNQNPLARQVAPAHNRNTPVSTNEPQKRIFTQAEIKDFYEACRKGWLKDDEAARMEKEIDRAVAEGRVRG